MDSILKFVLDSAKLISQRQNEVIEKSRRKHGINAVYGVEDVRTQNTPLV
jgi:hypothetical protein